MTKEEKTLLVQLILEDIRGSWSSPFGRAAKALELSRELNLENHIKRISNYLSLDDGDYDGRFFRTSYSDGGYEEMKDLHNLESTICDKSDDFQKEAENILENPDCRFEDYDKFNN